MRLECPIKQFRDLQLQADCRDEHGADFSCSGFAHRQQGWEDAGQTSLVFEDRAPQELIYLPPPPVTHRGVTAHPSTPSRSLSLSHTHTHTHFHPLPYVSMYTYLRILKHCY